MNNPEKLTLSLLALTSTMVLALDQPQDQASSQAGSQQVRYQSQSPQVNRATFDALRAHPENLLVIDLRRPDEIAKIGGFAAALNIQFEHLEQHLAFIPKNRTIVTVSNHGGRSGRAADLLAKKGYKVAGWLGAEYYQEEGGSLIKSGEAAGASAASQAPQPAVDLFSQPVGNIGASQSSSVSDTAEQAVAEVKPKRRGRSKPKHWSYRPLNRAAVPEVQNAAWVRTPIDAFVLNKLEQKGLTPSVEADRATLARRVYLDVLGFIPTPEQVAEFVNDKAPDAYEKLVDRVLASSHYGERQARLWLDLARYADSSGFQVDSNRLNNWRYRDYVINSFNEDKPYNRFIQEQIAGDELWPGDQNALIATGFMTQFPDNSNSRDFFGRRYQIITDITDTVGKVVLGQTLECARCHDHKFDKISQKDYFSFQSFFANINYVDNVPVAKKTALELAYDQQWAKWEEASAEVRGKIKAILDADREAALKYHKERYHEDSQAAIFKPQEQWNALDRWANHRLERVTNDRSLVNYFQDRAASKDPEFHSEWHAEKFAELEKLMADLKKFDALKPPVELGSTKIDAISELGFNDVPSTYVLDVGNRTKPKEEVQPAFPEAITDAKPDIQPTDFSSGRRAALAKWLTSPDNPLTTRVFVNRIWDKYFGHGIVTTVSDFGKAGEKPSHPELLDYLAGHFIDNGWSIKKLHREILLSSVYRQSSDERPEVLKADPSNELYAVFPHKRLEAEQIRDSLLVASGELNDTIGGPSVLPPLPKNAGDVGDTGFGLGALWPVSKNPEDHNRRSLYIFTRRSKPYPILSDFNMAQASLAHSKREVTTTPLQALTLYNSEIIFGWSKALAGKVINETGKDEQARLDRLYQILFARTPSHEERQLLNAFLNEQQQVIAQKNADGLFAINVPVGVKQPVTDPLRAAAFVDLVHTVVNANEFVYRF
ncbi:MAG: DUF1553 domain-containing protein [Methylococcales bacterium]|nr:DUF1553 domain-containing protein [Methylococcales bacterium]